MTDLPKVLTSEATVRFQDCDPYGHLYNAKYIDYFMNAREDQLIKYYDLDIYKISEETGLGWVVAQNQIAYFEPARLMERVEISSKIVHYTPSVITVEFLMSRRDRPLIKAVMWTAFVHYDLRSRSAARHNGDYMQLYEQAHVPIAEQRFEDRVKALRESRMQ
ncbi:MAG: acyl-CoA thioesterase [Saprospiraceae bacterium]|nr:acyl-CoA thioesterase [Saprospiraceae bacterium]